MSLADDAKTYIGIRKASYLNEANIDGLVSLAVRMTDEEEFAPNADMAVGLRVMHWIEKSKTEESTGGTGVVKKKKEGDLEVEYSVPQTSGSSGNVDNKDEDLKTTGWGRELLELIRTHIIPTFWP